MTDLEHLVYDMNAIVERFGAKHIKFIFTFPGHINGNGEFITMVLVSQSNGPVDVIGNLFNHDWTVDEFFNSSRRTFVEYCQMMSSHEMRYVFTTTFESLDEKDWLFIEAMSKCNNVSSVKEIEMKLQLMGY
jgi:hypothetical protein